MLKCTLVVLLFVFVLAASPALAGKKEYVCGLFTGPLAVPCIKKMLPAYWYVETSNAYIIGAVVSPKNTDAIWQVRTRIFYEDGTTGVCYSIGNFYAGRFRAEKYNITCGPE